MGRGAGARGPALHRCVAQVLATWTAGSCTAGGSLSAASAHWALLPPAACPATVVEHHTSLAHSDFKQQRYARLSRRHMAAGPQQPLQEASQPPQQAGAATAGAGKENAEAAGGEQPEQVAGAVAAPLASAVAAPPADEADAAYGGSPQHAAADVVAPVEAPVHAPCAAAAAGVGEFAIASDAELSSDDEEECEECEEEEEEGAAAGSSCMAATAGTAAYSSAEEAGLPGLLPEAAAVWPRAAAAAQALSSSAAPAAPGAARWCKGQQAQRRGGGPQLQQLQEGGGPAAPVGPQAECTDAQRAAGGCCRKHARQPTGAHCSPLQALPASGATGSARPEWQHLAAAAPTTGVGGAGGGAASSSSSLGLACLPA